MLTSLLPLSHLLHHASVYLSDVHFIIPCTPYPTKHNFLWGIFLIIYYIASHHTIQDKAVKNVDC